MQVTVYIADGEIDLVSDSDRDRKTHAKDLREMGCKVTVKHFQSWETAEAFVDKFGG